MQIYIHKNGQQYGPYSQQDVAKYLNDSSLSKDDMAWYEGLSGWMPLSQIPEFSLPLNPIVPPLPQITASPAILNATPDIIFLAILGIAILCILFLSFAINSAVPASVISIPIVIITSIWIAFDSHRFRISVSKSPYSWNSGWLAWLLTSFLLWIFTFPYYLFKRAKTLRERNLSSRVVSLIGALIVAILFASYFF